jgi:phosphoribosylformimino-5-aminoimidazole carboxamide ribotide isomerase
MLIIPAIDLKDGCAVRLVRGEAAQETVFSNDPIAVALRWRNEGAQYLHVVDLSGAFEGEPAQFGMVVQIARESGLLTEVGGGIRTRDTVLRYLNAGLDRVIIGTRALESPEWLAKLCEEFPGRIAAGVDARGGHVALRGWVETSEMTADDLARRLSGIPLRAVIFTDISVDGTLAGPAIASTRAFAETIRLPVIASGGVGSLEHVRQVAQLPIAGVILGRALYAGAVSLSEAIAAAKTDERRTSNIQHPTSKDR